ncbi:unnamed protein product [Bursaphelenchus okinawaensis]|uniref:Uncharacterized protein n=1 Tax=Bursaphelenchus okinawaensis TaxID=465554 RepID=A0A811L6J0_9BILA|nr:unnamed protein product [Bursaphelenchus okinawaensis]CAG9118607.1 unnamed protein product [Bursaphelenchus okinawaensis]
MQLSFVLLVALVGAATSNYCNSGSSFPKDCEDRQKNRGCLLAGGDTSGEFTTTTEISVTSSTYGQCTCSCESSGSDEDLSSGIEDHSSSQESGSGSGFGYDDYCLLFQYFYNISIEITDVTVREAWIEFIEELQVTVIYDQSLTYDEKLVAVWSKLEIFLTTYSEISELVLYTYIEEWSGYVFDIQTVVVFIQYQYTSTIIELDASEDCALFDALRNCTAVDAEFSARIEVLIQEITVILESTSYSYSYQLVLVYQKFEAFFAEYSQYESTVLQIEIEGYGSFASFYKVSVTYWQIYNFDIAVGGSASDCALIQTLTTCYENVSSGSTSERAQIKELVEKLTTYYESNTGVEVRVEYFVAQFYEWLIIQEWSVEIIFSLEIQSYGTIYELIVSYAFSSDCGCVDFTAPTTIAGIDVSTSEYSSGGSSVEASTIIVS